MPFQFEYSSDFVLTSIPEMRAFPKHSCAYDARKQGLEKAGKIGTSLDTEVTRVKGERGAGLWSRPTQGTDNNQKVIGLSQETREEFDEIIMATDVDAALGIDLGWRRRSPAMSRRVLVASERSK